MSKHFMRVSGNFQRSSMHEKKPDPEMFPDVGEIREVAHLPIAIGKGPRVVGELRTGWDGTTKTCQLWEILADGKAEFIGYVVGSPPGGIRRKLKKE